MSSGFETTKRGTASARSSKPEGATPVEPSRSDASAADTGGVTFSVSLETLLGTESQNRRTILERIQATITAEERAAIERTLRFAEGNIDVHVETRDAVADAGATVAAVAGSTSEELSGHTVVVRAVRDARPVSTDAFRFTTQSPTGWALSQATSAEQRVGSIRPELREVRLGIPGRVRTAAELSDAQVAQVLNAQLNHVTEREVGDLLASFGAERQELATQVLGVLSRSGNLNAFSDVAEALAHWEYAWRYLYVPMNGGFADSLCYLGIYKSVLRSPLSQKPSFDMKSGSLVMLDRETMERLRTDENFVKEVLRKKAILVHPAGFLDGINPFNTPTITDILDKVRDVMKRVELLRATDPKASTEELIGRTLHSKVIEELKSIHIGLLNQVDFLALPPAPSSSVGVSAIVANLNGAPGMTENQVTEVLSQLDESWRPLAREAVAQLSEVQSHRSMALLAREQFEKIVSYARTEGVSPEDILFAVKDAYLKSYGIANYIFKEANAGKLRADQFVDMKNLARLTEERPGRKTLVVALDDFSGSGESLLSAVNVRGNIRDALGPTVPIVCAPYVASTRAFKYLEKARIRDSNVTMIPGRVVASFDESELYKVDKGYLRQGLDLVMGEKGYEGTGSFVSLPYMGPDNNCTLFGADYFNPYFILGKRRAVRTHGQITCVPSSYPVFADIVQREVSFARADIDKAANFSPQEGLRMLKRVEELTAAAQRVNIGNSCNYEIQMMANALALKCRGEIRYVAEAVRDARGENVPQQLLLNFEAAQELSRRLLIDDIEAVPGPKVASANELGGV
jgi:hypothetical protein